MNKDWRNIEFKDESCFYLHCPGVSRLVPKGENNIVVKENYSKSACLGSILKHGNNQFRAFWRKYG